MKRFVGAAVLLLTLSSTASAQLGNIFESPGRSAQENRSAWERLPPTQLDCIEQALQRERSSLNRLVQQGVYPNSLQARDLLAKCTPEKLRIGDPSDPILDSTWASRTLVDKVGYFGEVFWFGRLNRFYKCEGMGNKGYAERKACLEANGQQYKATSPERCVLTITEYKPSHAEPTRSWDGKITNDIIVGRRLTFPLAALDESLIERNSNIFNLYFEIKDRSSIVRSVAMSTNPTAWIDLPGPPLVSDLPAGITDDNERSQELSQLQAAWGADMRSYDGVDVGGFSVTRLSGMGRDSSVSPTQQRESRMRTFLRYGTESFGVIFREAPVREAMLAAFIDTIKSIRSTCSQ